MKKKILALFMVLCLVLSTMPVAFATPYADETALEAQSYITVSKDESGKTTAFSLDFETGIDPITEADLELFKPYASDTSAGYLYYISNYGTDEGEWNGALNRAYLYATQDEVNYKAKSTGVWEKIDDVTGLTLGTDYYITTPGQLIHNQWTTNDDGTVKLNPNNSDGSTPVYRGYGNYLGYTPNVVAGGKYFPEITAFSHAPAVQNGAAYSGFDEASEKAKYSNGSSLTSINTKGDIANLSVVSDPKNSSNKVVKLSGSAPGNDGVGNAPMADFSIIGKENVDLAGKITKFEAKVYVAQDKTITDSTVAGKNTKPFTMQIVKNNNFSGYPTSIRNNGLMYTSATSATRNIERILNGSSNDEYLDAVTFHAGNIYLGKVADGINVGAYETGKWYTVRYYLDATKATPVNAVEIVDADNNLVASKKADVTLNTYGTFGYLAGDDETRIASCQEKYSAFSGFDAESTYSVFLKNDTLGYDGVANVDFVGYVDDISFAQTSYMPSNISSREFTQDFENPAYDAVPQYSKFYSASSNNTERYYISNGDTAKAALASNSTFIIEGDLYENQYAEDGTLKNPAGTSALTTFIDGKKFADYKSATTVKTENFRTGGLAGYTGFTNAVSTMVGITGTKTDDDSIGKIREMFVVTNGDKELTMNAYAGNDAAKSVWFGREGMDIYGQRSKISFDLKNKYATTAEGSKAIVTLSISKNTGNLKSKIDAKTAEYAMYNGRSIYASTTLGLTDAVTIYGGKAYIGNGIDSSTGAIDETKYICDMTDTANYTVDVYLDYQTNVSAPALTVVIKNADGSVKAIKEGLLPVSSEAAYTSVHSLPYSTGFAAATDIMLFNNKGNNSKATFTADEADSDGYGVYVAVAANSTNKRMFLDNFTFASYEDGDIPSMDITASLDEATKTLSASIVSLSKVEGKLVIAEYNPETKALIQANYVDVDSSVDSTPEVAFVNALTQGSTYKVFLWDGFANIYPITDSFEPVFVSASIE